MARPTKLTPDVQTKICTAIQAGNYIETASAFAGINKSTLYEWLKRGGDELARVAKDARFRVLASETIFVEFSNAVEEALAQSELHDVLIIQRAASGYDVLVTKEVLDKDGNVKVLKTNSHEFDWRASAWRLERKFPDRWGRREKVEVSGEGGGPVLIPMNLDIPIEVIADGIAAAVRAGFEVLGLPAPDELVEVDADGVKVIENGAHDGE